MSSKPLKRCGKCGKRHGYDSYDSDDGSDIYKKSDEGLNEVGDWNREEGKTEVKGGRYLKTETKDLTKWGTETKERERERELAEKEAEIQKGEDELTARFCDDIPCIATIELLKHGISEEILSEFKSSVQSVYYPWDTDYNTLRINSNRRFNVFPMIIVMAESEDAVIKAFEFARKYNIKLCTRSGAHSNEGYSLCDGMVIDQNRRKLCVLSDDKKSITVESGVNNGDLVKYLSAYGLAVPAGTCPNTGLAGLTLGGGVGFMMRKYGLTCDNLLNVKILLSSGEVISANDSLNSDLFWACRGGGGGNFGIVLNFTYRVYEVTKVIVFEMEYILADLEEVVDVWQKVMPVCDDDLTAELNVMSSSSKYIQMLSGHDDACIKYHTSDHHHRGPRQKCKFYVPNGEPRVLIDGLYLGSREKLNKIITVFEKMKPKKFIIDEVDYIESARRFSGKPHRLPFVKVKTAYVGKKLSISTLRLIRKAFEQAPSDSRLELQSLGGAVNRIHPSETAFPHRNELYWCGFSSMWYDQKESEYHIKWVQDLWKSVFPHTSRTCYVNFMDSDLGKNYLTMFYSVNRDKLILVKSKYDPKNVFCFDQGIPVVTSLKKKRREKDEKDRRREKDEKDRRGKK